MSLRRSIEPATAITEEPTPGPTSAVAASAAGSSVDFDPAKVTSVDELPAHLRENPFVRYVMAMSPEEEAHEHARSAACEEARSLYGDEGSEAELAALLDGTHPLCRLPEQPKPR